MASSATTKTSGKRALYTLDPSGEATLLAIGALPDVMISNPALKNSPAPPLTPQTPPAPDATIPIVAFGPKEQTEMAATRTAKAPVTVPDEATVGSIAKKDTPANVPTRKLAELFAEETATRTKSGVYVASSQAPDTSARRPPKRNQTPPETTTSAAAAPSSGAK